MIGLSESRDSQEAGGGGDYQSKFGRCCLFVGQWEKVARTIKGYATKVEIVLPNSKVVEVNSTLLRVWPKKQSDCYICVMLFSDLSRDSIRHLQNFIPN